MNGVESNDGRRAKSIRGAIVTLGTKDSQKAQHIHNIYSAGLVFWFL